MNEIVFECRRSPLSVVGDLGSATFIFILMFLTSLDFYTRTEHLFFLYSFFLLVLPIWYGVYAYLRWESEVHTVYSFSEKEGGVYRKRYGVFKQRQTETSITRSMPDLTRETSLPLRLWGWATGERVIRMSLRSDGQTVIPSSLMPEQLYKSISNLKGDPTFARSKPSDTFQTATIIRSAVHDGLIDKRRGQELMLSLLESEVLS